MESFSSSNVTGYVTDLHVLWTPEKCGQLLSALHKGDSYESLQMLRTDYFLNSFYEIPSFVEEGYSTSEHAQAVMNLAVELEPAIPIEQSKFNLAMLVHDLCKGYSRRCGYDRDPNDHYSSQHHLTKAFVAYGMASKAILPEPEAVGMAAFVSQDIIGKWMLGNTWDYPELQDHLSDEVKLENTIQSTDVLAHKIGLSLVNTYKLMKAYFLCDSGSYTTRGWYIGDTTGERTACKQLYDCVYKFNQPLTGSLIMVPEAAERLEWLDRAVGKLCATELAHA